MSEPFFIWRCCRWGKAEKGFCSKRCRTVFTRRVRFAAFIFLRLCVHCALFGTLSASDFLSPLYCLSALLQVLIKFLLCSDSAISVFFFFITQCTSLVSPFFIGLNHCPLLFALTWNSMANNTAFFLFLPTVTIEVSIWWFISSHAIQIVPCFCTLQIITFLDMYLIPILTYLL